MILTIFGNAHIAELQNESLNSIVVLFWIQKSVKKKEKRSCCLLGRGTMLCACSGEQFRFEEAAPRSPESLATRDYSVSGLSSRTGDLKSFSSRTTGDLGSKYEDAHVDEVESTLKEALSLNYEVVHFQLHFIKYTYVLIRSHWTLIYWVLVFDHV